MSSNEEEFNEGEGQSSLLKKRRIQRACDICRRKKIRCDGGQMPENRCSNCMSYGFSCTYVEAAKKRGPPKGYVESLEVRVEKLQKLLRNLCKDEAIYKELTSSMDNWPFEQTPADPSSIVGNPSKLYAPINFKRPPGEVTFFESVSSVIRKVNSDHNQQPQLLLEEDDASLLLADNFKDLDLVDKQEYRFFGKSSGAMLIHTALELKQEYVAATDHHAADHSFPVLQKLRKDFWAIKPWEKKMNTMGVTNYKFPDPDLSKDLVDLYFEQVNLYLPLLHRSTFEKSIAEGLHLVNTGFACVYLLVCAVGGRYSKDPRVLLDGVESYHSAGWKWFDQVQIVKRSLLAPPTLYDLQLYCLSVQFLQGCSAPQSCWTMVGIGIRLAQDVGAHRRKLNSHTLTPDDELWKRAFWILVCMDRMVSSSLGRPCAIQDEDFDLDLPVECDDEYWENEDPEKRFKQPPNKPSLVTAFNLYVKLNQILAFSLRTIYSINKSKILLGFVGHQFEQHIVAELDSALNKWVDSVPDHLRWDPTRENEHFFNQSVLLYSSYYHVQILVHRPFIPSPSKPSPLSFPSLAICTNAARSCSHVIDVQRKRTSMTSPQIHMSVFTSGIVLLLSIWGGKRSGLSTDPNKEMADVHKCMQALRSAEDRWHSAGRLWDILYELASVGDLPLPHPSPPATNKRERDSETPISATPSSHPPPTDGPRNIAGSRRVNKPSAFTSTTGLISVPQAVSSIRRAPDMRPQFADASSASSASSPLSSVPHTPQSAQTQTKTQTPHSAVEFALPVYSDELGKIPLHAPVTFTAPTHISSQQQMHPNFWYPDNGDANGPSSSQNIPLRSPMASGFASSLGTGYPSIGEMSSMTDSFSMEATALAAGMMFDTMAGTLAFNQQGPAYDQMSSSVDMPHPMSVDPSQRTQQMQGQDLSQLQSTSQQPQDQPGSSSQMMYGFDNDTFSMWSNAPTGFELDEWGTYLTNVSELTHGHQPTGAAASPAYP